MTVGGNEPASDERHGASTLAGASRPGVVFRAGGPKHTSGADLAHTTSGAATPATAERDLETIYRVYAARVSRWAERLAGPGADLEDIVHDVFLVVQRRLGTFRGDAAISTWLYGITIRVVQGRRRKDRLKRWLWVFRGSSRQFDADAAAAAATRDGTSIEVVDETASALEALQQRQATALLYRFLDQMDEKHRTAVVLFELEGVPCRDIAAITGVSVANVWVRVSRGREKLVQAFAEWEALASPAHGRGMRRK